MSKHSGARWDAPSSKTVTGEGGWFVLVLMERPGRRVYMAGGGGASDGGGGGGGGAKAGASWRSNRGEGMMTPGPVPGAARRAVSCAQ